MKYGFNKMGYITCGKSVYGSFTLNFVVRMILSEALHALWTRHSWLNIVGCSAVSWSVFSRACSWNNSFEESC